jgi:hypothetical protein
MSYCRFSSDDFQSDVYCYESDAGYEIHVAKIRYAYKHPLPPVVVELSSNMSDEDVSTYLLRERVVAQMVDEADKVEIGLPCDGDFYTMATAEDAAEKLTKLKAMGYRIPDGVIECLLQEAKETAQ